MKATKTLMAAALAAAGLMMVGTADAATRGWHGGYHGGYRYWGPSWGLAIGVPLGIGAAYAWGYPYGYYYDGPRVVYREVIREDDPGYVGRIRPLPEEAQPATAPRTEGAPASAPLYMNYCESARAYYPKVTSCPEGWRFEQPRG